MADLIPERVDCWHLGGANAKARKDFVEQKKMTRHNIDNSKNLDCWECKHFGCFGCRKLNK